jgi:HYD1 signature containing ADP-ribosyltransferase
MSARKDTSIRVRHYTRVSSKDRILEEMRIVARDQNKVFLEKADHKPHPPRDAEAAYLLKRGKGNAYVEFDVQQDELESQTNRLTGETELFVRGDVDLTERNPIGQDNRGAKHDQDEVKKSGH